MCLAIPGRVVSISPPVAVVDFGDVEKEVRLDVVDETVEVGDFVLNHAGFAIRKIPEAEAKATIELFQSLIDDLESPEGLGSSDDLEPRANGGSEGER